MQIDFPCTCGHAKVHHVMNKNCTVCSTIWNDLPDPTSINRMWIHPFRLDNLKYLEQLSNTKE
jgi:hypothetical protein